MLRNKKDHSIIVRYDGRDQIIGAGESFDIRVKFYVKPEEVKTLEGFFIGKYPELEAIEVEEAAPVPPPPAAVENPFEAAEAQNSEEPVELKEPEKMTKSELQQELVDKSIIEGWDGDSKKEVLLNLVKVSRAKG